MYSGANTNAYLSSNFLSLLSCAPNESKISRTGWHENCVATLIWICSLINRSVMISLHMPVEFTSSLILSWTFLGIFFNFDYKTWELNIYPWAFTTNVWVKYYDIWISFLVSGPDYPPYRMYKRIPFINMGYMIHPNHFRISWLFCW